MDAEKEMERLTLEAKGDMRHALDLALFKDGRKPTSGEWEVMLCALLKHRERKPTTPTP